MPFPKLDEKLVVPEQLQAAHAKSECHKDCCDGGCKDKEMACCNYAGCGAFTLENRDCLGPCRHCGVWSGYGSEDIDSLAVKLNKIFDAKEGEPNV